jgi:O-antigen/teichoic acid export membrane protein
VSVTPVHPVRQARTAGDQGLRSTFGTNVALAALAAVTGVLSARLLHPAGEGELAAIQTWPFLLGTLAMLGLDSALVYFIARQPERGRQFTSTAVLIGLLSSVAMGAVAWFVLPLALRAQSPQVVSAARVFLLIGGIYALVGIPHGSLRGARSFTAWNLFRIAPGLAWLLMLAVSWLLGHPNAIPLSRWYLGGSLVCGLPFLVVVYRKLQGPLKPSARYAPEMLRFGLPSAVTSIPLTINLRFDQLLIIAFLPARLLGLYVVAVSWSSGVAPLLQALGTVLFPHVSAESDANRQGHLLATALQGGVLVGVITSVPFIIFAPIGLPFIFGQGFAPSVPSALVLVPAGAILAWGRIAEAGLQGLGRPTIVLVVEVLAAIVTVAALPILLHTYGILGAALASLLGYSTIAVLAVGITRRSTQQSIRSMVIPTWPVTKSLAARSASAFVGRRRSPGQHRSLERHHSPALQRAPGRHRVPRRHRLRGAS